MMPACEGYLSVGLLHYCTKFFLTIWHEVRSTHVYIQYVRSIGPTRAGSGGVPIDNSGYTLRSSMYLVGLEQESQLRSLEISE